MATEDRLATFLEIASADNVFRFQSFFLGQRYVWRDLEWDFLPFDYSGYSSTLDGGQGEGAITLSRGASIVGPMAESNGWYKSKLIRVYSAFVLPGSIIGPYVIQHWEGAGARLSAGEVTIELQTSLSGNARQAPPRTLTSALVGPLPSSASLRF